MTGIIKPTSERHDLLVMTQKPDTRMADGVASALIQNLAARRIIRPVDEALHKEWVEVYCAPGDSAHEAFTKGLWSSDDPPFLECCVRWGDHPVDVIDGGSAKAYFYIEFRGARFRDVGPLFKRIFKEVMYSRVFVLSKPHTDLPPHKVVAEEDAREDVKRRKRTGAPTGNVGMHVEEF